MLQLFRCPSQRITDFTPHRKQWHYTPTIYIFGNDVAPGQRRMSQLSELTKPSYVYTFAESWDGVAHFTPMHWSPASGSGRGWRIPHGTPARGSMNLIMADGHHEVIVYNGPNNNPLNSTLFTQAKPWTTLIQRRTNMGLVEWW